MTEPAEATALTRTFIEILFSDLGAEGFNHRFYHALSEDIVWTATGTSPLAGTYHGIHEYKTKVLKPLHERLEQWPKPRVDMLIVEGEWASVLFHSVGAKGRNGVDFNMQHCWLVKVIGEKIVEGIGFYDQKKVNDLFA